jgi:hypothetical protein
MGIIHLALSFSDSVDLIQKNIQYELLYIATSYSIYYSEKIEIRRIDSLIMNSILIGFKVQ